VFVFSIEIKSNPVTVPWSQGCTTVNKSDNRVVVYVTDEQLAWLRSENERLGAPVGEIIRRAIAAEQKKAEVKP